MHDVRRDVATLANAVEEELADAGRAALPGVQKAEVEAIRRRAGGLSWSQLQAATRIAYLDGYLPNSDIVQGRPPSGKEQVPAPWRQRVLMSHGDLLALADQTERLAHILGSVTQNTDFEARIAELVQADWNHSFARKIVMAELLVVTLQALGVFPEAELDKSGKPISTRRLAKAVIEAASEKCSPDEDCFKDRSLMRLAQRSMLLPKALPFDPDGILSLPLRIVLAKDPHWLRGHATRLRQKAAGLRLIEGNFSIPEWPEELSAAEKRRKRWLFRIDTSQTVAYLHVPLSYIP